MFWPQYGQILDSEHIKLFKAIVKESKVPPTTVAVFLTETLKALKRDGVQVEKVSANQIREVFSSIGSGKLTKEAAPEVCIWLSKNEGKTVQEAIDSMGLNMLSDAELEEIIDRLIATNKSLIEERGANAS